MTRLRTVVVDDEPLARKLILAYLEDIPEIDVVRQCANGREAVEAVLELEPDLLLLDINMPGLNGFGVIKKIQPELLPMVIFCTAYERYALAAFDIHAVDYIVKPLDEERLQLAVKRALVRHREELHQGENKGSLIGAIDTITNNDTNHLPPRKQHRSEVTSDVPLKKITIKDTESIKLVRTDDIMWIDAAGDYMCVHAGGDTHIMRCTMKQLLEQLDETAFKRVHRSTIVNLNSIEQVIPHTKGEYFLQMGNGERIKVSRSYRDAIKQFLDSMKTS